MDELKALAEAIVKNTKKNKTNAYETLATVLRIDGEKVYVHIDGGAPETPATATMACKEGDTVRIHVEGGKAWVIGNVSAPATDDTAANTAHKAADTAQATAKESAKTATNFVTEKGTGGQILVHPEGDTKNAVLIGQDVQIIRNGTVVATYSDAVKIGNANSGHTEVSANEQKFISDDGTIVMDMLRDDSRVYTITETAYTEDTEGQSGSYVNKAKLSYPMYKLVGIYARNGTDITKDVTYTYDSSTYTLKNMSNADSDGDPGDMKHYIFIKYIPDIDNVTLAIGRYPLADNRGKLLALGNGVSASDRRNVLEVDMLGNLRTVGTICGKFSYTNGERTLIPEDMSLDKWGMINVYQNRVSDDTGGYYKCGRYVYVYVVCKVETALTSAAAFTGLPIPASKNWGNAFTPLTALTSDGLNVPCFVNQYGSLCMTAAKGKWVIINGYYFSASM